MRYQHQEPPATTARRITPLTVKLQNKIASRGPISVAAYVDACLMDAEEGYYIHSPAIGADADFVTAPEISQIFGELIGVWSAVVWQHMGSPGQLNLLELGPGRGTLMVDLLRAFAKVPKLAEALHVHLLEINPTLRQQQENVLKHRAARLTHHANPTSLCDIARETDVPWIVIGNEFLDAQGVRQLVSQNGKWHERTVECAANGELMFGVGEAVKEHFSNWPDAANRPDGQIFETIPALGNSVAPLLQALTHRSPVACLFIDYGHVQTAVGETLQAMRRHAYEHPLTSPGEADLTVHVDFAEVACALQRAGLIPHAVLSQAEFLGRLGIVERTSHLMAANPARAAELESATMRLMAPNGMGSRFKAIAGCSPQLLPLPIFDCISR